MNIGTGKDHPTGTPIHLVDLLTPHQSFSAAEFRTLALQQIKRLWRLNKLPIVVGGTGQYVDAILHPQETYSVKPNPILRKSLNRLPLAMLQNTLRLVDSPTYAALNNSDLHNPHRLIRKIELRLHNLSHPSFLPKIISLKQPKFDTLHFVLTAPRPFLYQRIDRRLHQRLERGLLDEIAEILKDYSWSDPGLNTIAYQEFKPYFTHSATLESALKHWQLDEHHYCKRQLTWLKRIKNAVLIDISKKDYKKKMGKIAVNWYNCR